MTRDSEIDALEATHTFLLRYLADREAGTVLSLEEYQALFPKHKRAIAREIKRIQEQTTLESRPKIGKYLVERELGRGGQGVVYLAYDPNLQRKVALKVLAAQNPSNREGLERFGREATAAARLDHPCICSVLETGESDGLPYIALRYVEGETLSVKIDRAKRTDSRHPPKKGRVVDLRSGDDGRRPQRKSKTDDPFPAILDFFATAADALQYAHNEGIIHRDLKPGNLMVTPAGQPVILDFGLARIEDGTLSTLTGPEALGTPKYMAPEQIQPDYGPLDRRTDIYSLAATLFECVTLRHVFEAPTRDASYRAVLTDPAPSARKVNPTLPADLGVVLQTALEREQDLRYQAASDFAEDLRRVLRGEMLLGRPGGPFIRAARWSRRNRLLLLLTLGAVAALGIVAWSLWERRESQTQREQLEIENERQRNFLELLVRLRKGDPPTIEELRRTAGPEIADNLDVLSSLLRNPDDPKHWKEFDRILGRLRSAQTEPRLACPRMRITESTPAFRFSVPSTARESQQQLVLLRDGYVYDPELAFTVGPPPESSEWVEFQLPEDHSLSPGDYAWEVRFEDRLGLPTQRVLFQVVEREARDRILALSGTGDEASDALLRAAGLNAGGYFQDTLRVLAPLPEGASEDHRHFQRFFIAEAAAHLGNQELFESMKSTGIAD